MPLGIYISVPFCRSKCSYCNFASGVFSGTMMGGYVERVIADMGAMPGMAAEQGTTVPGEVDSIYLGGGTPSLLPPQELKRLFFAIRSQEQFAVTPNAEITVECAPGTLSEEIVATLVSCGVNRVSLGVQSFVDQEAAAVGRLHTRDKTLDDIARLRRAGIENINIDLIAGLPHQTSASWDRSLDEAISSAVPHVSVYMLEVDEDSRLGRELIAGGTKYHAHFVPDDDLTAELYETACERLNAAGIAQYEISNFARVGRQSCHNLKYWTRYPYLGFGVDAHSMLPASEERRGKGIDCVRFATADSLDQFLSASGVIATHVTIEQALEERFFLGLRLNRGVSLKELRTSFGAQLESHTPAIEELVTAGMLSRIGDTILLTRRGRLLSNEVFEKFIAEPLRIVPV